MAGQDSGCARRPDLSVNACSLGLCFSRPILFFSASSSSHQLLSFVPRFLCVGQKVRRQGSQCSVGCKWFLRSKMMCVVVSCSHFTDEGTEVQRG